MALKQAVHDSRLTFFARLKLIETRFIWRFLWPEIRKFVCVEPIVLDISLRRSIEFDVLRSDVALDLSTDRVVM